MTSSLQETKEMGKVLSSSLTPTHMNLSSPFAISSPLILSDNLPCSINKHPDCWLVPMEYLSDHVSEECEGHYDSGDFFGFTMLFVPQQFYPCRVDINQRIKQWSRLKSEITSQNKNAIVCLIYSSDFLFDQNITSIMMTSKELYVGICTSVHAGNARARLAACRTQALMAFHLNWGYFHPENFFEGPPSLENFNDDDFCMKWDNKFESLAHTSAHPGKPLELLHASSMSPLSVGGWDRCEDITPLHGGPGICHVSREGQSMNDLTTFISKLAQSCPWIRAVVAFRNDAEDCEITQYTYFGNFNNYFRKGWKGKYRCIYVENELESFGNSDDEEIASNFEKQNNKFCSWEGETSNAFSLVPLNGKNGSLAVALQILQNMKESGSLFQDVSACLFTNAYDCTAEIIGVVLIDFKLLSAKELPQWFRSRLLQEFLLRNLPTSGWVEKERNYTCTGRYFEASVMHNNERRSKAYEDEKNAVAQKNKSLNDQRPVVAGSYALHQFMEDEEKNSPDWKPNDIDVWFPNRYNPGNLAYAYAKHILYLSNGEVKLHVTSRASRLSAEQCGTDDYKRMKSELVSGVYPPGRTATDAVDGRFTKSNSETVKMDVGDMFELIYCIEKPSYEEACSWERENYKGPMRVFFENNGLNISNLIECEKTTPLYLGCDRERKPIQPTFGKLSFIGTVPNERHYAITPIDVITRFDLSVCQVAMTVDVNGKRSFFFGDEQVKDDILQRQGRVMFVDNIRLLSRVEKYEKRRFNFLKQSSTWYTLWNAWSSAQEAAAAVEQCYSQDVVLVKSYESNEISYDQLSECLSDDFKKMKLFTKIDDDDDDDDDVPVNLTVGLHVFAQWKSAMEPPHQLHGTLFPGTIKLCRENNTFDVDFDDGDHRSSVPLEEIHTTKAHLKRYRSGDLKLGIDAIQKHCVERSKSMIQIIRKQRDDEEEEEEEEAKKDKQ